MTYILARVNPTFFPLFEYPEKTTPPPTHAASPDDVYSLDFVPDFFFFFS